MKAIHINWTLPYQEKDRLRGYGNEVFKSFKNKEYFQPDHQLLVTILSILWWKKLNGPIKLYTDKIGLEYYKKLGIDKLYNEIDTEALDNYKDVDPAYFWTSGKVYCLTKEKNPFVFLDQDFIVKSKIDLQEFSKYDITIPHWEIPRGHYYFTKQMYLDEIKHCPYPKNYNDSALVANTSFLYVNNLNLIKDYYQYHKTLVDNKGNFVPEWFWLLTDQGILGHTIRENNYSVSSISSKLFLCNSNHASPSDRSKGLSEPWYEFTSDKYPDKIAWEHLWYLKAVFTYNNDLKNQYVNKYKSEILTHFPKYSYLIP